MIETSYKGVHSNDWIKQSILDLRNELVLIKSLIPWEKNHKRFNQILQFKKRG